MMLYLILFCTLNLILIIEDFRYRKVHLILIILLLITNSYYWVWLNEQNTWYTNLAFLSILIVLLFVYIKIRFKGKISFKEAIGYGDIIFLIAMTPVFNLYNFFIFFNLSILLALITFFILNRVNKDFKKIPFISFMGISNLLLLLLSTLGVLNTIQLNH